MLDSKIPNECFDQKSDKFLAVLSEYAPNKKKTLGENGFFL